MRERSHECDKRQSIQRPVLSRECTRSRHSDARTIASARSRHPDTRTIYSTNALRSRCPEIAPPGRDAARRQATTHVGHTLPSAEYASNRRRSSK